MLLSHLSSEFLVESFSPTRFYWHGGPKLNGGLFKLGGNNGYDSGGLFFSQDNPSGRSYAYGYAASKPDGHLYKVRINIPKDKILDFTNSKHKSLLKTKLSKDEFEFISISSRNGHIDWATIDSDRLEELGFQGAVLFERPAGHLRFTEDVLSVVVFDPKKITIVDSYRLADMSKDQREEFSRLLRDS